MTDIVDLTAQVVSAYVSHNAVPREDVPAFIRAVYAALSPEVPKAAPRGEPAVDPKESVFDDVIISLEDGKPYKTLKRHLTALGMTPEQYRAKWDLPPAYPMIAPNYSEKRSALAKTAGLGKKSDVAQTTEQDGTVTTIRPRGRPRKVA
jgi:predicted transcriptional regulator